MTLQKPTRGDKNWDVTLNTALDNLDTRLQSVEQNGAAQGVQGTRGSQGTTGLQGSRGSTGAQGTQGTTGLQGATGLQGNTGNQGTTGTGAQGLQGSIGLQGVQGTLGSQGTTGSGAQGATGSQGLQGRQGTQGNQGTQGILGSQGTNGTQGTQGIAGGIGLQGSTGAGAQGTTGAQGVQGTQGRQGTQGLQGLQGPQGTTGIQGTLGTQGTTGAQGIQGPQGTTGTQGATGTQGLQGRQGTTGNQGTTGLQGFGYAQLQGTTGTQGLTGSQGTTGNQGTTGPQGTTGSQGVTGIQGNLGTQGTTGSGAQGTQGVQGTLGTQGPAGTGGTTFTLQGIGSALVDDETASTSNASSTTESAAHKTYTVTSGNASAFTSYRIEALVLSQNTFTTATAATVTWRIKVGGTTQRTAVHSLTSSTTGGQQYVGIISYTVTGAQTASTTFTITSQNSVSNAAITSQVIGWRVVGMANTTFNTQGVQGPTGLQGTTGSVGSNILKYQTGSYQRLPVSVNFDVTNATLNRVYYSPLVTPATATLDRIGIRTGSTFSGTATVRLGLYSDSNGKPGTLVYDAGTVSCTAASTDYEITISQSISTGVYWVAACMQSAPTTTSFMGTAIGGFNPWFTERYAASASGTSMGYYQSSVTGAFSTASTTGSSGQLSILPFVRSA